MNKFVIVIFCFFCFSNFSFDDNKTKIENGKVDDEKSYVANTDKNKKVYGYKDKKGKIFVACFKTKEDAKKAGCKSYRILPDGKHKKFKSRRSNKRKKK